MDAPCVVWQCDDRIMRPVTRKPQDTHTDMPPIMPTHLWYRYETEGGYKGKRGDIQSAIVAVR